MAYSVPMYDGPEGEGSSHKGETGTGFLYDTSENRSSVSNCSSGLNSSLSMPVNCLYKALEKTYSFAL